MAAPSSGSVLQDYRDWVRQLVQHEYTHILHLDHVGGVPAAFNRIFGKLWIPNGLLPSFFVEGTAVLNESEGDAASGRNAGGSNIGFGIGPGSSNEQFVVRICRSRTDTLPDPGAGMPASHVSETTLATVASRNPSATPTNNPLRKVSRLQPAPLSG